jgi:mannan endo-1,6-alpha-mannosidase
LWAFAALTAAEYGLREPPTPYPTWFGICDNIFNDYVSRWIESSNTCGGGLKWQVFPTSPGYDYKNSISNGGFLQLAARLARFTNNQTYYDWAERVWDWSVTVGLIDTSYNVFDGSDDKINCTGVDHTLWSYNVAVYLYGTAVLYNYTNGSDLWANRTTGLLDFALQTFVSPFPNATDVLYEHCELSWSCNIDQYSFRAYLARWLAKTTVMMPETAGEVATVLRASALAAAGVCTGEEDGTTCGARWYLDGWDGTSGLGQALSALEVVQSLLVTHAGPPQKRAPT